MLLAAEVAKLQTFFTEVEVQMPGLKKYFSKVLMQLFDLSYQIAITCLNAAANNSHYAALEMIYALTEVCVCECM